METRFFTKDGVDITSIVRLHRKYHGTSVVCMMNRRRRGQCRKAEGLAANSLGMDSQISGLAEVKLQA